MNVIKSEILSLAKLHFGYLLWYYFGQIQKFGKRVMSEKLKKRIVIKASYALIATVLIKLIAMAFFED